MTDLALRNAKARLFHTAARHILEPLRVAAADGIELVSADGAVRKCFPILAIYAADYPEQCLVACTRYGSRCPKCDAAKTDFDSGQPGTPRNPLDTLARMTEAHDTNPDSLSAIDVFLRQYGVNYVPQPFWEDWPHTNIHQSITPDILHQLYQGIIKHLTAWATELVGADELDARFKRAGLAHGLRHFKDGISGLQRVSGEEHKAIAKQLLACMAGIPQKDAVRAARCLLDFTYLAQYACHSEETLRMMDEVLADFHSYSDVFIRTGAAKSLELPKLHSLVHYTTSIRLFGTTGGYNTEQTERLHIDFAKQAYDASHHREGEYLPFMCSWLERREKMNRFAAHQARLDNKTYTSLKRPPSDRKRPAVDYTKHPSEKHCTLSRIVKDHGAASFAEELVVWIKQYVKTEWGKLTTSVPLPPYTIPTIETLAFDTWNQVKFHT
ncbi:hypothetical protein EXIGLDRAFT_662374, partial [Exidia glandulosa HHB12029]